MLPTDARMPLEPFRARPLLVQVFAGLVLFHRNVYERRRLGGIVWFYPRKHVDKPGVLEYT